MEQVIQLVADRLFLAAIRKFIYMQRQAGDGFSQDSYTGIHCSGLHGSPFIDGFAAGGAAEKKTVCTSPQAIFSVYPLL